MIDDETRYRLLKLLYEDPQISQREMAKALGVSLGKANYCLNALAEKGLVKARNFRKSENKKGYTYFLTPKGIDEKARAAVHFLKRKLAEYEGLKAEIEALRREVYGVQDDYS